MHTHTTIQNAFRTQNTFSIKGCNHGNGGYYFSKRLWANVHHVYWMVVSTCKNILLPAHIPNTSSIAGDALSTCTAEWTAFNCMTQLTETLLVSALAQQPHAISILLCIDMLVFCLAEDIGGTFSKFTVLCTVQKWSMWLLRHTFHMILLSAFFISNPSILLSLLVYTTNLNNSPWDCSTFSLLLR